MNKKISRRLNKNFRNVQLEDINKLNQAKSRARGGFEQ
jgi:hypothetical protein